MYAIVDLGTSSFQGQNAVNNEHWELIVCNPKPCDPNYTCDKATSKIFISFLTLIYQK